MTRWGRRSLLLSALGIMLSAGAQAQNRADYPPGAVVQSLDTGAGAELRRNLTSLSENPRSVAALTGAGRASLAMGDAEAAYSFFERAHEVEPRSAGAKAGMAAALVRLGRARDALPLFAEAVALGVAETEIAGDRGLAHDMLGDPRRAQADYALALRGGEDAELRRRLALSLAISGQRAAALRAIDAQLRVHDRAGWRTQAFILALTGDPAGAARTARSVMPSIAQDMAPFFARLAALSPSQKAMAVHFGHFPSNGVAAAHAGNDTSADPGAMALAEGRAPAEPARVRTRPAEPVSAPPRRRPDAGGARIASLIPRRPAGEIAPPVTREVPPPLPPEPQPPEPQPQLPEPSPPRAEPDPAAPAEAPVETASTESATAGFTLLPQGEQPAVPQPAPAETQPAPAARLQDLASVVASLPAEEEARPARPARTAGTRPAPERSRPAQPRNPSRHWVQVAGGANKAGLVGTFARLRERAPALLGGRAPYTTPLNQTNRLLVGPFDSSRAAQAFVNQLADRDVSAFAWTSPAGQEIERLRIPNDARSSRSRPEPEQRPAARRGRTG